MRRFFRLAAITAAALPAALAAQEPAPAAPAAPAAHSTGFHIECPKHVANPGPADIIMPHLVDSKHLELPWLCGWDSWGGHITLPTWNVTVAGQTFDMGPTKHVVYLFIAATITAVLLLTAARAHRRHTHAVGHPRGFAAGIEAVVLYLRNIVFLPVLGGHGGEKYIPFCLSLFFFIGTANLLGMIPYGSTATGNLAVTATLAAITFVMIEVAGMRALGKGYFNTIVYWPHGMSLMLKIPLTIIMTPIEIISKFTKPFALTVRLFANMVAGHVIILSLIGIVFLFGWLVAPPALAMALFIMLLEILVAFIQAFIFALLAAVFIGQIRAAHH